MFSESDVVHIYIYNKPSYLILIAIITYEINVKTIFETKIND